MSRATVAVFGALMMCVGVLLIIVPHRTMATARTVLDSEYLTALGLLEIVIGVALLVAGLRHLVRIPLFVTVVGGVLVLMGVLVLAHPVFTRDLMGAVFFRRGHGFQTAMAYAGGALRLAVGALLLYSALPQRREEPAVPIRTVQPEEASGRQVEPEPPGGSGS